MLLLALAACVSGPAPGEACAAPPQLEVAERFVDLGWVGPDEVVSGQVWLTSLEWVPVEVETRLWFGSTWATDTGPVGFRAEDEVRLAPGAPTPLSLHLSPDWEGPLWDVLSLEASTGDPDAPAATASVLIRGRGLDTGLPPRPAPAWLGPPRAEPEVARLGEEVLVDFCLYDPEAEVGAVDLYLDGARLAGAEPTPLEGGARCWEWSWTAAEEGHFYPTVEASWGGHLVVDSAEVRVLSDEGCLRTPGS